MKKIGFYIAKLWAYGIAITPFPLLYLRSDIFCFLVYRIAHYRRKVVRQNLINSFPEKDLKELKRIEKAFYHNFCDLFVEICKLLVIKPEELQKHVRFNNPEVIQRLYDKQKSLFVAIPHSGNWEWFGKLMHVLSPHKCSAIYKKVSNADFDKLMYQIRTNYNLDREEMLEARVSLKYLLQRKDLLNNILIVADQSPQGLKTDYWTEFLHQDTCWFNGVEKMAKLLDYAVVFAGMKRVKRGYYEVDFELLCEDVKEAPHGSVVEKYVRSLENFIVENPDNWLWSHRRWKHSRTESVKVKSA